MRIEKAVEPSRHAILIRGVIRAGWPFAYICDHWPFACSYDRFRGLAN